MKDDLNSLRLAGHYRGQRYKLNFCVRKENRCFQVTMAVFNISSKFRFIKVLVSFISMKAKGGNWCKDLFDKYYKTILPYIFNARVAQPGLEHFPPKEGVAGSNPVSGVFLNVKSGQ